MNNKQIYETAKMQSAIDLNCHIDDFDKDYNIIVISKNSSATRKYLELPFACNLVSYGNNIVASVDPQYEKIVRDYIDKYSVAHCFETPNMHVINDAFSVHGLRVCFMAEYFLPDMDILTALPCPYTTRVLTQSDFTDLYNEKWSNVKSARNAIKSGFRPAWVEMTVKSNEFMDEMNR